MPLGARTGRYRFVVTANRYRIASRSFHVRANPELTAVRVPADAGFVGIHLTYPPAIEHEAVGDPAGDDTADLTYRPPFSRAGKARFLVNGNPVRVRARRGGLYEVRAGAGTVVVLRPGAARDRFGNRNGNALQLTP